MATSAHRMIQDQNLTILYGATPGGKTDLAKADKRGGLGGRKALNDISNSRKPSGFNSVKKDNSINVISIGKDPSAAKGKSSKASEKGKVGGRKALSDLTNSVKTRPKQAPSLGQKLNAVAEEKFPSCLADERFLHNHQECIKAQMPNVDKDYFLKSVGLGNDIAVQPSARMALPLSSKKVGSKTKLSIMEELLEHDQVVECKKSELPGCYSPACRSPQSPKAPPPYMSWEDDKFSDLMMVESP